MKSVALSPTQHREIAETAVRLRASPDVLRLIVLDKLRAMPSMPTIGIDQYGNRIAPHNYGDDDVHEAIRRALVDLIVEAQA